MAIRFTTTRAAARISGVKILVHGRAGSGKTRLCRTAPSPLIISAEPGLLSLADYDIPTMETENIEDVRQALLFCRQSAEAQRFRTVCLDTITEIAERCLVNAKLLYKDPRQAYGELLDEMMVLLRGFRDLPGKHVYFSAHEEREKNAVTGVVMAQAYMPGLKLGPALPHLFDEVFNLAVGQTPEGAQTTYLQTQPDWQTDAKDRSGKLAAQEPPDLGLVITKITGVPA